MRRGGRQADAAPGARGSRAATGRARRSTAPSRRFALERADALLDEHVIPLFLAPPDVCAEAGKTLYYGIVPTTSSEWPTCR